MPSVIDLCCGEGGAALGYCQAGFDTVVGIDHIAQPRFPFQFFRADATTLTVEFLRMFDLIHASPPCQALTEMRHAPNAKGAAGHLNLIPDLRAVLEATGRPYVIENVRGARAHLIEPVSLFGQMFDLHMVTSAGERFDLERERLFETNWPWTPPWRPGCSNRLANVFGGHLRCRSGANRTAGKIGRAREFIGEDKPALARELFQMPWATMNGMSEAVPPAYTEFLGEAYLATRMRRRRTA